MVQTGLDMHDATNIYLFLHPIIDRLHNSPLTIMLAKELGVTKRFAAGDFYAIYFTDLANNTLDVVLV